MRPSDSPQATIPPSLLITSYRPDIVFYNESSNSVALLELTCLLDSIEHLKSARDQKQGKREYQELQSEFDCHGIPCCYDTIEISVLGHYLPVSLSSFMNCVNLRSRFLNLEILTSLLPFLFLHQEEFSWQEIALNGLKMLECCKLYHLL